MTQRGTDFRPTRATCRSGRNCGIGCDAPGAYRDVGDLINTRVVSTELA